MLESYRTVSYTHLDVYKRQLYSLSTWGVAPKLFSRLSKHAVPAAGLTFSGICLLSGAALIFVMPNVKMCIRDRMCGVTYLTRIVGYLALRNRTLSPRLRVILEAVPGCVLISVIAPYFASTDPVDLAALGITLVASIKLRFLPAIVISIASAALLRQFF